MITILVGTRAIARAIREAFPNRLGHVTSPSSQTVTYGEWEIIRLHYSRVQHREIPRGYWYFVSAPTPRPKIYSDVVIRKPRPIALPE